MFCLQRNKHDLYEKLLAAQVISFDKLNQLRHVLYFKNAAGVLAHMKNMPRF